MRFVWIFVSLMLPGITSWADHLPNLHVWPTIPFIRGQDLCQYQDAYGQSRAQQAQDIARELGLLLQGGANPQASMDLLETVDRLIQRGRTQATTGFGMDMLLEGSFKAALDRLYDEIHPKTRHIRFFNPSPLNELVRELRDQKRQGYLDASMLGSLNAVAWGSYSYSPNCKGDVVVTLHIETTRGQTFSYQARGLPESVMQTLASQAFQQLQKTHFPSTVTYRGQKLLLLGSPGAPIGEVSAPRKAQSACENINARLPTPGEYVFLSELGDWNGGINAARGLWALSDERIWAPELPKPSPVRSASEIHASDIRYICVR